LALKAATFGVPPSGGSEHSPPFAALTRNSKRNARLLQGTVCGKRPMKMIHYFFSSIPFSKSVKFMSVRQAVAGQPNSILG
jgi:hypothetical protein